MTGTRTMSPFFNEVPRAGFSGRVASHFSAPQQMIQMMLCVEHIIFNQEAQSDRPSTADKTQSAEFAVRYARNHAGEKSVVLDPEPDNRGPFHLLVAVNRHPVVLCVCRSMESRF